MNKTKTINIFWFRRDLRLNDNNGLFNALKNGNIIPIFIFDPKIIDKLDDKKDRRINFIFNELILINNQLKQYSSHINIFYDEPINVFKHLSKIYAINKVFYNHDYEPYALKRDHEITAYLKSQNIEVHSFKDQVIFERNEVLKKDLKPYTIFTPYAKQWKEHCTIDTTEPYPSEKLLNNLYKDSKSSNFSLEQIGFEKVNYSYPSKTININLLKNYDKTRDYPFLNGTSKLSVHLRFGTISIRQLVKAAFEHNETFLNELIWREFYMMILWHFAHVVEHAFKKGYDYLNWVNNEQHFFAWCNGETGYPIVDAGMRELNQTGFMHNRLRMITASFLTKHLLIDWRWGEAYFAKKLLDYELSSNNGGWQWAASTGCDAVPYFRIFNPETQAQKFDKNADYIKKWVPEYKTNDYPEPIVEHKFARERALNAYKNIKQQ